MRMRTEPTLLTNDSHDSCPKVKKKKNKSNKSVNICNVVPNSVSSNKKSDNSPSPIRLDELLPNVDGDLQTSHTNSSSPNASTVSLDSTVIENSQSIPLLSQNPSVSNISHDIRVADKRTYIWLSGFHHTSTTQQVVSFVSRVLSVDEKEIVCRSLKSSRRTYTDFQHVSFRIGLRSTYANEALQPNKWPVGISYENEPITSMTPTIADAELENTHANTTQSTDLQRFYAGKNIFITGGTGFLGKTLIDKLLRSCPDIENIYLLVRPKKGVDIHTRLEEIFDDDVFTRLRETVPKFRYKLIPMSGDCSLAGLGMKINDRQTLITNVDIVFHAAATVRFDEKLRLAVNINVHGTRELLELCTHMQRLQVVMHVSTAYSNCHLRFIEEKFYNYPFHLDDLSRLIDKLDDKSLDNITPTILGKWPNTYAFTKALSEDLIRTNGKNLPIGMFRPAIVTSSVREPVVGYIDNLYGPTGVVAGVGIGVLRTMHCNPDITANIVPVDMTVNALIVSAWDVATNYKDACIVEDIPIYNYVSSVENPLTWGQFNDQNIQNGFDYPFSAAIWYISFHMHKTAFMNRIYMVFLHLLPALFIDLLAMCVGQRPRLLKMYKKIHKFSSVISFFCTNEWMFTNSNVQRLWKKIGRRDQELFDFNIRNMDWEDYSHHYIKGMRLHLFKDDLSTLEAARKKWTRLYWSHQLVKTILASLLLYTVSAIFSYFFY